MRDDDDNDMPRLATLDDDGWTLLDAEEMYARGERIFWLPSRWEREHLEEHVPADGHVKLVFRILDPASPSEPMTERMWVTLTSHEGELYHGHLANEPRTVGGTAVEGMPVWFRAEHVIDYAGPDGADQASARADAAIRCDEHGTSERCWVCAHLLEGEGKGFHAGGDPAARRPDAWCDACEQLVADVDDWETLGDRHPPIALVCGGCYDELRSRHRRN